MQVAKSSGLPTTFPGYLLGRWNTLSEEQRQLAEVEARRYEALSEKQRDMVWNKGEESIEAEAEGGEVEI